MRRAFWLPATVAFLACGGARANDIEVMRQVVGKAIEAHGGAANLARFAGMTWKGVSRLQSQNGQAVHQVTGARQHGRAAMLAVQGETEGQKFHLVRVINGDQAWVMLNGKVQEVSAPALAEERERLYSNWIATLVPLLGEQCQLAPTGRTAVNGRPALGVRVSFPGCREVTLYFDEETFLLVKKDNQIRDLARNGEEVLQETFYMDYVVVDGVRTARKQLIRWNGKPYLEMELTEIKPQPRVPESLFQRPTPN
jgi:hypothetical protein